MAKIKANDVMQFIERGNCRMYLKKQFELSSNNDGAEDPNNDGVVEPFVSLDPALAKAGTDFETEVIEWFYHLPLREEFVNTSIRLRSRIVRITSS